MFNRLFVNVGIILLDKYNKSLYIGVCKLSSFKLFSAFGLEAFTRTSYLISNYARKTSDRILKE